MNQQYAVLRLIVFASLCTGDPIGAEERGAKLGADQDPPSVTWTFVVPHDLSSDEFCEVIWRIPVVDKVKTGAQVVTEEIFQPSEIDLRELNGGESVAISVWFGDDPVHDLKPMRFTVETTLNSGASHRVEGTLSIPDGFTNLYSYMPSGSTDAGWFLMISKPFHLRTTESAYLELGYEKNR
jgi:hypothetical protein